MNKNSAIAGVVSGGGILAVIATLLSLSYVNPDDSNSLNGNPNDYSQTQILKANNPNDDYSKDQGVIYHDDGKLIYAKHFQANEVIKMTVSWDKTIHMDKADKFGDVFTIFENKSVGTVTMHGQSSGKTLQITLH